MKSIEIRLGSNLSWTENPEFFIMLGTFGVHRTAIPPARRPQSIGTCRNILETSPTRCARAETHSAGRESSKSVPHGENPMKIPLRADLS